MSERTYDVVHPILRDGVHYAPPHMAGGPWTAGLPEGQPLTRITLDEDDPGTRRLLAAGFIAPRPRPGECGL